MRPLTKFQRCFCPSLAVGRMIVGVAIAVRTMMRTIMRMLIVRKTVVRTAGSRIAVMMIVALSIFGAGSRGWASGLENGTPRCAQSAAQIAQQSGDAADRTSEGSG